MKGQKKGIDLTQGMVAQQLFLFFYLYWQAVFYNRCILRSMLLSLDSLRERLV